MAFVTDDPDPGHSTAADLRTVGDHCIRTLPHLRAWAAGRLGAQHADDFGQSVYEIALTNWQRVPDGPIGTRKWLFGIAHNLATRFIDNRTVAVDPDNLAIIRPEVEQPAVERLVVDRMMAQALCEQLSAMERLTLATWHLPLPYTAEAMGCTIHAARKRRVRLRSRLIDLVAAQA